MVGVSVIGFNGQAIFNDTQLTTDNGQLTKNRLTPAVFVRSPELRCTQSDQANNAGVQLDRLMSIL